MNPYDLYFDISPAKMGGRFTLTLARGVVGRNRRLIEGAELTTDYVSSVDMVIGIIEKMCAVAAKLLEKEEKFPPHDRVLSPEKIQKLRERLYRSRTVCTARMGQAA